MSIDIQKFFNVDLPANLAANQVAAKQINIKFSLIINGDGGGKWSIDLSDSGPRCIIVDYASGNTVMMEADDFQTLYANPQANYMKLFGSRKIIVIGDPPVLTKFVKILQIGPAQ